MENEKYKISEYIGGSLMLLLWPFVIAIVVWGLEIIFKQLSKDISLTEFTLMLTIVIALYIFQRNR